MMEALCGLDVRQCEPFLSNSYPDRSRASRRNLLKEDGKRYFVYPPLFLFCFSVPAGSVMTPCREYASEATLYQTQLITDRTD